MNNVELNHWSKFQTNLTTFRGVLAKKTTQKQPKTTASAGTKTSENLKLGSCKLHIMESYLIITTLTPFI